MDNKNKRVEKLEQVSVSREPYPMYRVELSGVSYVMLSNGERIAPELLDESQLQSLKTYIDISPEDFDV